MVMVQRYQISGPGSGNPVLRALAALAGIGLMVAGAFLGFFVFLIAGAALLIGWGVFRLRLWWLRRQGRDPFEEFNQKLKDSLSGNQSGRSDSARKDSGGRVIDGRYSVVDEEKDQG